jgi:hypothetical protein
MIVKYGGNYCDPVNKSLKLPDFLSLIYYSRPIISIFQAGYFFLNLMINKTMLILLTEKHRAELILCR